MPATSKSQQRLMGAAEHGATFPLAKKVRKSMTKTQMHDFASGSMKGKPEHVGPAMLKGDSPDITRTNAKALRKSGKSEFDAVKMSMSMSQNKDLLPVKKSHPNRHKNLKGFLHPKKVG